MHKASPKGLSNSYLEFIVTGFGSVAVFMTYSSCPVQVFCSETAIATLDFWTTSGPATSKTTSADLITSDILLFGVWIFEPLSTSLPVTL